MHLTSTVLAMVVWLAVFRQEQFCISVGINEGKRTDTAMGTLHLFTSNLGLQWKCHILTILGERIYILQHVLSLALDYTGQHSPKHRAASIPAATVRISKVAAKWVLLNTRSLFHRSSVRMEESKNLNFFIVQLYKPPVSVSKLEAKSKM